MGFIYEFLSDVQTLNFSPSKQRDFVFERLGLILYDFLRKNNYHPFPIDIVWEICKQILESMEYMHHLHLIHTDLKHKNIRFVSSEYKKIPYYKNGLKKLSQDGMSYMRLPKSTAIKLIDFGSATFETRIIVP